MSELIYRSHARIEDLEPGDCTIHPCGDAAGKRWWNLWFCVFRDDEPTMAEDFVVPVAPNGPFTETGPGGRTWGFTNIGGDRWQVDPSINILADQIVAGPHSNSSRWHQTPTIVNVPDDEPWMVRSP